MKFNVVDKRHAPTGISATTSTQPTGVTHEGGPGFQRSTKWETFLAFTTMFVGEDAFYEKANEVADRQCALVRTLAVDADGWEWLKGFGPWLRGPGNIRTGSILLAAEAVHARLEKGLKGNGNSQLIAAVLQRPDEPAELIAYWITRWGRAIPKPVKRGIAEAVRRLYTEGGFLRYDGKGAVRMGDVLELTHAKPTLDGQGALFRWMITARHNRDELPPASLVGISARHELSRADANTRHDFARRALNGDAEAQARLNAAMAGQWEWLRSWLGDKPRDVKALTDAEQWRLAVPRMGYMALIRNLRNLDEAGISNELAATLAARIADPAQVAKSRQYPFRFFAAYEHAPSLQWAWALEQAIDLSLGNVPTLPGRTLILIDTSASMNSRVSMKSAMSLRSAAAIFGLTLWRKNSHTADVYGFGDGQFEVGSRAYPLSPATSLLKMVETFNGWGSPAGHGTQIANAVHATFRPGYHHRVIILTDMQTFPSTVRPWSSYSVGDVGSAAPKDIPIYAYNVAGYSNTAMPIRPGNNRHELGGLTDRTFDQIIQLEAGQNGTWPWEKK